MVHETHEKNAKRTWVADFAYESHESNESGGLQDSFDSCDSQAKNSVGWRLAQRREIRELHRAVVECFADDGAVESRHRLEPAYVVHGGHAAARDELAV